MAFYHQYRIWPGEHVTPSLELITPSGGPGPTRLPGILYIEEAPDIRTDAEQTIVWFIDRPSARVRHGRCVVLDQSHDRRLLRRGRTLPRRRERDLRLSTTTMSLLGSAARATHLQSMEYKRNLTLIRLDPDPTKNPPGPCRSLPGVRASGPLSECRATRQDRKPGTIGCHGPYLIPLYLVDRGEDLPELEVSGAVD